MGRFTRRSIVKKIITMTEVMRSIPNNGLKAMLEQKGATTLGLQPTVAQLNSLRAAFKKEARK
jgi:hypothetical protein